jgi:uncharacterized protein YjlB
MNTISLVEGTTEPIDVILKADGVAISLTGKEVALVLHDRAGAAVPVGAGDVEIVSAGGGRVRYSPPSATTLLSASSPLTAHWRVRSSGKDTYIPRGPGDQWKIHKQ